MGKKEDQHRWYESHKAQHFISVAINKAEQIACNQKLIIEYLLVHPCVDCGEKDIVVLQFDHVRGVKRKDLSQLLSYSEKSVREEIEKCDVRCANCHQRKTMTHMQSYRVQWVAGVSGNIPPS